jgi:protein-S-isoprenylcysteine O-methyltransferase Ste14
VTTGPYAHIRHPIYAAAIYLTWAGALTNFSSISVSLAVIASAGLAVRMIAEETLVVVRYPEYADYARKTKRVLPYVL